MGEIGRGTSYILIGKILWLVIALVNAALIPRYLGPSNLGFYLYWMAVFFIFKLMLDLSAPFLITKFVPELKETDEDKVPVLLMRLIKIKFYFVPPTILAGILFFHEDIFYFLIIYAAALIMAISELLGILIYSYGRMREYTFYKISMPALRIFLVISLFALFKEKGIILAIISFSIIICLGLIIFTRNLLPPLYDKKIEIPLKNYFRFSIFAYLGGLFSILVYRMIMIFSKHYIHDMRIIGFLGLSLMVCITTIKQVIHGISESLLPYIIKFKALDSQHAFNRLLKYNWRYTNILLFPLIFALLILVRPGIEFIVGRDYLPSVKLIVLLLPAVVFYSWVTILQNKLFAEGKARYLCWINLAGFLVFFVSSIILIKRFGIIGSVVSIFLNSFVTLLLTVVFTVRRENLFYYYGGATLKPLIASLIMAGWLALFDISSIWKLVGIGISGMAIYVILMLIIKGITLEDVGRIKEALFVPQE